MSPLGGVARDMTEILTVKLGPGPGSVTHIHFRVSHLGVAVRMSGMCTRMPLKRLFVLSVCTCPSHATVSTVSLCWDIWKESHRKKNHYFGKICLVLNVTNFVL